MVEALKSDQLAEKVGGRFRLCALVQRRLEQLLDGARPLVDRDGRTDLEVVIEEILQDKITYEIVEDAEPAAMNAGTSDSML
ncbi:MAG: DNA-directed RNA polymerase subunit omega [Phycisphaerales bacterium]|jgi:DNA-directed RNA polymerase subunit omega|nr:DNA-directed RNA polymerase subunit omega [Phycisphaerales bacterium]